VSSQLPFSSSLLTFPLLQAISTRLPNITAAIAAIRYFFINMLSTFSLIYDFYASFFSCPETNSESDDHYDNPQPYQVHPRENNSFHHYKIFQLTFLMYFK